VLYNDFIAVTFS